MTAMPTCDVIDAVPDAPSCDTQFRQFGRKRVTAGPIRTLKVFQDNGLVKNTLATPGNGRFWWLMVVHLCSAHSAEI